MSEIDKYKKYEPHKIPGRQQSREDGAVQSSPQTKNLNHISQDGDEASPGEELYYEIEYDACPIPGVGKFVLKSQKIKEPEKDEARERFGRMRDIAKAHPSHYDFSRFFEKRIQLDNAGIFYKQGVFMKDFTDDYADSAAFSQYFPNYQMMGYNQLRTYFTWRTAVRNGEVSDTSLSYAFLYIYELLNNIGVDDPQEGLDKLMFFWRAFSVYNGTVDKYILRWLKDYHIYYELPQTFKEFVRTSNLTEHYPYLVDADDEFDLFCTISKYDIRKSTFFAGDNAKLIEDCFYFVKNRLRQIFEENGIHFDESIFEPTRIMTVWNPFKDALFYQWAKQRDRRIVLSKNEIYICSQNNWTFSTVITAESGRQLIGYVMKQMEAVLRKVMKYKFKLFANLNTVTHPAVRKLNAAGLSLETMVSEAVLEFYREATKTVVKVDHKALSIIRLEALSTLEKLIVPEQEEQVVPAPDTSSLSLEAPGDMPPAPPDQAPNSMPDIWENLKNVLSGVEIEALSVILQGDMEIKRFADECGIMLEVLIDGINEKAMDFIGDNLLDDEFTLYDDYKECVKELIE